MIDEKALESAVLAFQSEDLIGDDHGAALMRTVIEIYESAKQQASLTEQGAEWSDIEFAENLDPATDAELQAVKFVVMSKLLDDKHRDGSLPFSKVLKRLDIAEKALKQESKQQPSAPVGDDVERIANLLEATFQSKYGWSRETIEQVANDVIAALPNYTALIRQLVDALDKEREYRVCSGSEEPWRDTKLALEAGEAYLEQQEGK